MSTAFYGLHIAKSGLFASQKGLEVVGNNIANVNTAGYTRQRLNLSSIPSPNTSGVYSSVESATVGAGVSIDTIEQVRNKYLDSQFRSENSLLGEWQVKADALYYVEDLFNDTTDAGIDDVINKFFDTIEELSKSPESEEIRTLVRQNATVLTETMNYYSDQLESLQNQQNEAIAVDVGKINSLTSEISEYNTQIQKYERNGDNANELRDKRNTALDELSNIIDITYSEGPSGIVTVKFGKDSLSLVDETTAHKLIVKKDLPDFFGTANKFYSINIDGNTISSDDLKGGTLKGYLDMRDDNTDSSMGIPYFMTKLNELTSGIVQSFNSIHQIGYTYPSDSTTSVSGIDFFDPTSLTAKSMRLSDDVIASVYNIAASTVEITGDLNKGNGLNALDLLGIIDKTDIPVVSNIEQFLKSIISDIAVRTSYSNGRVESESILLSNIEYKRDSVSGVSNDEEMTNMISFQKAYSAAARLITAIDEQLDTLINKTGVVGR